MVHSCPECRVFLSFQRKETLVPDLVSGHWYGCPGCARNVCGDCGRASGRRCRECGATLEPDQIFPRDLKPLDDWRSYLPSEDDAYPGFANGVELIACATEDTLPEIDAALDDWNRARFRREVFTHDLSRRLGCADAFMSWGSAIREFRWTPEWERRLAVAADYYRGRVGDVAREALHQRELLRGWGELVPASQSAAPALLEAALHPDADLAEDALQVLHHLQPPLPEVLAWSIPVLRGGELSHVRAALAVLRIVRTRNGPEPDPKTLLAVEQRLGAAFAERGEAELEALVRRLLFTSEPWPMDVTAVAIVALGLTREFVPLLREALSSLRPHQQQRVWRFIASLGEQAETAELRALLLERISRAETHDTALPLLGMLGRMGGACHEVVPQLERWTDTGPTGRRLDALGFLIEFRAARGMHGSEALRARCQRLAQEVHTTEERMGFIRLLFELEPVQRSTLFPELPAPAELLAALLEETDGACAANVEERWLKELLALPRWRSWLMSYAAGARGRHYLTSLMFRVAGPECEGLLVAIQRLLADRNTGPFERMVWVEALGRIARGPTAPARVLLQQVFLDTRESVLTRLAAARALWSLGVRELPVAELAPVLRERSAVIRSWALLFAAEVPEELLAPLREDTSPLVRWVLSLRLSNGRGG
ncbi:hypothetical protein BO221_42060 [Archangium sp. Cb G35]|uniref:hypothetical protein n=1 Tax=Archangium sp. Cb G35 TaxID=1920190 RepID=UPI000936612D|nr:hypothetical protein [Archangium sp. Cb G35]OJT18079.1 hypothetical protein BO221_42060 [Archangium sp. Cb G35]